MELFEFEVFLTPCCIYSGVSNLTAAQCSEESNLTATFCSGVSNLSAAWCRGGGGSNKWFLQKYHHCMMQREIKYLCYKMEQGIKSPQHNITGSYDALLPNTAGSQVKKFGRLTRRFKELSCKISHTSVSILQRITYLNSPSLQFFWLPGEKNQRSAKHQVQNSVNLKPPKPKQL